MRFSRKSQKNEHAYSVVRDATSMAVLFQAATMVCRLVCYSRRMQESEPRAVVTVHNRIQTRGRSLPDFPGEFVSHGRQIQSLDGRGPCLATGTNNRPLRADT